MTDRTRILTVLLDRDYRIDDVQAIKDAIGMVRGVIKVDHDVLDGSGYMAIESAKHALKMQIIELFK
jgi:hypothetical protein